MKVGGRMTLYVVRGSLFHLILQVNILRNIVEGSWKNNSLHGFATYTDDFGYSYEGYWVEG
jgi:hypothetical protein